jgi:hypothetical protein
MSSHCTVSSFCLQNPMLIHQDTGHHPKTPISLSQTITLHIPIIIFTGPHIPSIRFHHISHHIVNKTMFIPKVQCFKLSFIFFLVEIFENIFEITVIFFEDGIFGAQVKRILARKRVFKTGFCKIFDRLK